MNTRFGRAFRYEVRNYFRAVAILWLVMALIPAAMLAITYFLAGETAMEGSFNGYSIAVGMFGLVLGMVGLRENQRVLNQNGVSRRSAFLADVAALAVAAVLIRRIGRPPLGGPPLPFLGGFRRCGRHWRAAAPRRAPPARRRAERPAKQRGEGAAGAPETAVARMRGRNGRGAGIIPAPRPSQRACRRAYRTISCFPS